MHVFTGLSLHCPLHFLALLALAHCVSLSHAVVRLSLLFLCLLLCLCFQEQYDEPELLLKLKQAEEQRDLEEVSRLRNSLGNYYMVQRKPFQHNSLTLSSSL